MTSQVTDLVVGDGPPLAILLFLPRAGAITGLSRWSVLRLVRPLAEHFTVHVLNRPPGLPVGSTMADIAAVHAHGIGGLSSGPVHVLGVSTGGAVALQLAVDHPHLVDRLVLASTAHTLGALGRDAQRRYVDRALAGHRPSPALAPLVTGTPVLRPLVAAGLWLADGPGDHTDAATVLRAEDTFDIAGRLDQVASPVLLIHGDQDRVYPPGRVRETADRIPDATVTTYAGGGHEQVLTDRRFAPDVTAFLLDGS
ncbi:alpha/beta fold hydrolase [Promicromonospora sp. NPDC019610]|uniref:alpha/beta fold hydrolase n=1 Tax=Promicromonospora sp. NPDC019610 TaxID=3364405 RepID=UPI00378E3593